MQFTLSMSTAMLKSDTPKGSPAGESVADVESATSNAVSNVSIFSNAVVALNHEEGVIPTLRMDVEFIAIPVSVSGMSDDMADSTPCISLVGGCRKPPDNGDAMPVDSIAISCPLL